MHETTKDNKGVWHPKTGDAIARVGDAPFTAELVEATLMNILEHEFIKIESAYEDAMRFLDDRGVLRGNGEDEFTLTGRLQGIFEGGEGLQGTYKRQFDSLEAFRGLWKLLPNRIVPNDKYEADKFLVAELTEILRMEKVTKLLFPPDKEESPTPSKHAVVTFSQEETEAITELSTLQDLTPSQIVRQALRLYQYDVKNRVGPVKVQKRDDDLLKILHTMQETITNQEKELASLRQWKEEMLRVESEWDVQTLARKLGGVPGKSCRKSIHEGVLKMEEYIINSYIALADALSWTRHLRPTLNQIDLLRVANAAVQEISRLQEINRNQRKGFDSVSDAIGVKAESFGELARAAKQLDETCRERTEFLVGPIANAIGMKGGTIQEIVNAVLQKVGFYNDILGLAPAVLPSGTNPLLTWFQQKLEEVKRLQSLLEDRGPDGRNVRNEDYIKLLNENDSLKDTISKTEKVIRDLETRVFQNEQRIQYLTRAKAVSSSWAESSKKLTNELEAAGVDTWKFPETPGVGEEKEEVSEIELEHPPYVRKQEEVKLEQMLYLTALLKLKIQCRHPLSEEEGEEWFDTDRRDFNNPEIVFRVHPDSEKFITSVWEGMDAKHLEGIVSFMKEREDQKGKEKTENFLKEWEKWVSETATYFECGGGDITYPLLGLVGELGELVNSIVKYYRKADLITLKIQDLPPDLRQKLKDESYDALHFLMFLLNEQGISLEEIINYGRKKLEKRMEEGTIHKENRISGSLVGKKIRITRLRQHETDTPTPPQEVYVYRESIHFVTLKSDTPIRPLYGKFKIEIIGDFEHKAGRKHTFELSRNKFYEALK